MQLFAACSCLLAALIVAVHVTGACCQGRGGGRGGGGGGGGGGGRGGGNWGTRGGDRGGKGKGPPQEAIEACASLTAEAVCSFTTPRDKLVNGTCKEGRRSDQSLHCRPDRRPDGDGPGRGSNGQGVNGQGGNGQGGRGPGRGPPDGARRPDERRGKNSSNTACEGLQLEDPCVFRPPVMGDQVRRPGRNSQTGRPQSRDRPERGGRSEREGRCVPSERRDGSTAMFCRPLPPSMATEACASLEVNASCSFSRGGEGTYIELRAFTSTQPMAETEGDVLASFLIDGEWTDPQLFFSGAALGEEKRQIFALSGWPERVSLTIWSNDAWSYWKFMMNNTVLEEDEAGEKGSDSYSVADDDSVFANSQWWIEGPPSSQVLDIPYNNNAPEGQMQMTLRVYTSSAADAGTSGSVHASFLVDDMWTTPEKVFDGAVAGEEKTQVFSVAAWPTKAWLSINSVDAYSFWKIMLNDITLIEDPSGAAGSQEYNELVLENDGTVYWIQSPPASQTFNVRGRAQREGTRNAAAAVKGMCQEAWWDMMNGTLHCRPEGGPDRQPRVTQPNTMAPRWDRNKVVSDTESPLKVKMVVKNLVYSTLNQDANMRNRFVDSVKETVAREAGEGIYSRHVSVELSPGSVVVDATISPPAYIDSGYLQDKLSSSQTLKYSMQRAIRGIPNIENAGTGGPIEVADVQVLAPKSEKADEGEKSESDTLVMALGIAAGALGLVAIVACGIVLLMCKKKSKQNLEINGTTVAVGRPVQGNNPDKADNNAASGTPVTVFNKEDAKGAEP